MNANKPRLVGLNHVALDIGDVEEALRFYGSVFAFEMRGTHKDDRSAVMALAQTAGATATDRDFNFIDPWGNHIEPDKIRDRERPLDGL